MNISIKRTTLIVLCACMLLPGSAPGMIFKPPQSRMWDVWCFHHEGTWYLYYMAASQRGHFDDVLMNVYSLPKPASARIGFLDNASSVSELQAWTTSLTEE